MDRRTTLKWMLAAASTWPIGQLRATPTSGTGGKPGPTEAKPYGVDANLLETYHPGELWPLTFNPEQRAMATTLCDVIIPADDHSPSASSVGVVDFIDEWISAPYAVQRVDRTMVLAGLAWLKAESARRFKKPLPTLESAQLHAICDDICYLPRAKPAFVEAATFFARFRDLTAGGFYTTPEGRKDLQYIGNIPMKQFEGPSLDVLKKVGLA